jgi:hypothetical protein
MVITPMVTATTDMPMRMAPSASKPNGATHERDLGGKGRGPVNVASVLTLTPPNRMPGHDSAVAVDSFFAPKRTKLHQRASLRYPVRYPVTSTRYFIVYSQSFGLKSLQRPINGFSNDFIKQLKRDGDRRKGAKRYRQEAGPT